MLQIIRIEWLKVKNYRTFWILLGLAVFIIPASNMIVQNVSSHIPKQVTDIMGGGPFDFPVLWQTVANVNSFTSAIFGLLIINLIANEFTYRTHRQNIIDGWERLDFVLAKLCWIPALAVVALLVSTITGAFIGIWYSTTSFSFEGFHYLFNYFLQVLMSLSIALLLAMLVKRSGLATVLYLGYVMVVEQVLVLILKHVLGPGPGGLLPLQAGDEILPFPKLDKLIPSGPPYEPIIYQITIFVYLVVIIGWVLNRMLKTDL